MLSSDGQNSWRPVIGRRPCFGLSLVAAVTVGLMASGAQAQPLYSQSFDTLTLGTLGGQDSFSAPVSTGTAGTVNVVAGGLTPASPVAFPGGTKKVEVNNFSGALKAHDTFYRALPTPQSGTVYFSLSAQWSNMEPDDFFGFFLTTGDQTGTLATGTNTGIRRSAGFYIQTTNGYVARVRDADGNTGDGTAFKPAAPSSNQNTPFFFVVGITRSGTNATVKLWVNPITITEGTANSTATSSLGTADPFKNFYMFMGGNTASDDTVQVDNIRIGTTYADVVLVPEPATLSVLGLLGVGLLRRHRSH